MHITSTSKIIRRSLRHGSRWAAGVATIAALAACGQPSTEIAPAIAASERTVTWSLPRSADGTEGWLRSLDAASLGPDWSLPRSADGAEGWLRSTDAASERAATWSLPRSADGTEGWLRSSEPTS